MKNHESPSDYFTRKLKERGELHKEEYPNCEWKRTTNGKPNRIVEGDFYCELIDFSKRVN